MYYVCIMYSVCLCVCIQVLPPLRDVKNRPEVGNALRNKLVRLMTHIDTDVKNCAAEFLFVLCKESGEENIFLLVCFNVVDVCMTLIPLLTITSTILTYQLCS